MTIQEIIDNLNNGTWKNENKSYIHESAPIYGYQPFGTTKQQGDFTLDDYYSIPDDVRVELIDGHIFVMDAPTSAHQLIAGLLYAKLLAYVSSKKGRCLPIISPIDVQLNKDNKTMVQPDVIVVCDRDKVINRCVYGAPDLVIEVLSKSTRKKDMFLKTEKYCLAGVKEYWMIDPYQLRIIVYRFDDDKTPAIYSFNDHVPLGIFDDCIIDFNEVYEYIRFLYEREEDSNT